MKTQAFSFTGMLGAITGVKGKFQSLQKSPNTILLAEDGFALMALAKFSAIIVTICDYSCDLFATAKI